MVDEIIIAGATATGKTELSIELAKKIGGEIISVDSRQCYKRLNIGTAKPDSKLLEEVTHHNVSVLDLREHDSAALFYKRAMQYRDEIKSRGKKVIYCGGSTLHLQSLLQPLDDLPSADENNLVRLAEMEKQGGLPKLFELLQKKDPEYAGRMDGLNRQRIFRALDVWMQTGKPFSSFHLQRSASLPENMTLFTLHRPRKELHKRINHRTDQMLEMGFIEEVKGILADGYSPRLQSLQTVGYREAIAYLNGEISRAEMVEKMKTSTRRYAKRQITWMKRWPFAIPLNVHRKPLEEIIDSVLRVVREGGL